MAAHEFMDYSNWVVCGNVTQEDKYAYKILHALKTNGYEAVGFHPKAEPGSGVYYDLKEIPFAIDVLDLVVNPVAGLEIVKAAQAAGVTRVLAQPGARSPEIREYCAANGMDYLESCVLVELGKMGKAL